MDNLNITRDLSYVYTFTPEVRKRYKEYIEKSGLVENISSFRYFIYDELYNDDLYEYEEEVCEDFEINVDEFNKWIND